MLKRDGGDGVIGDAGNLTGTLALETIRPWRWNRQNMNVDAMLIHMLQAAVDVLPLQGTGVDPAGEFLVIKITHAAMGIGRFENHRAIEALHLGKISLGKNMGLEIDDHAKLPLLNQPSYKPYNARGLSSRIRFTTGVGIVPSSFNLRSAKISDEVSLWP